MQRSVAEPTSKDEEKARESSVPWVRLTRQYLAQRKDELLEQAIAQAEEAGEAEVVALLRTFQQGEIQAVGRYASTLQ